MHALSLSCKFGVTHYSCERGETCIYCISRALNNYIILLYTLSQPAYLSNGYWKISSSTNDEIYYKPI